MRLFYRSELDFLRDTLQKSHLRVTVTDLDTAGRSAAESGFFVTLPFPISQAELEPYTVYRVTDPSDLCYLYLLLPETEIPTLLLVGPYLTAQPSRERLLELGELHGISPARQSRFEEYYRGIPVLAEGDRIFLMLSTFCERIWRRPSFAIVDVSRKQQLPASPLSDPLSSDRVDDVLVNMKTMEKRYAYENELIRAVLLGQLHREEQLLSSFTGQVFERRLEDSLRNAKNYGVIMNTLLRKAAENGGVHPVYLDRISSDFAARIEQMEDLSENLSLMREMFRSYCRLVRKHAINRFSIVVQQTILLIDSDLSADLSLKSLAESQNVSAGYLSAIFKKDTGKTVSEYIREKRVSHAKHLLATTQLQVQTVALHCGIVDVQYFSKTFKRLTGKTPREYRESLREP